VLQCRAYSLHLAILSMSSCITPTIMTHTRWADGAIKIMHIAKTYMRT